MIEFLYRIFELRPYKINEGKYFWLD